MTVWWLAIDSNHNNATFEEISGRGVVAQGWAELGDMTEFRNQHGQADNEVRMNAIQLLLGDHYPGHKVTLPQRLTNFFFKLQPGDMFVAIEGMNVRGICKLGENPEYRYDNNHDYAHTWGPVCWFDWAAVSPDWAPTPSGQGVLAISHVKNNHDQVADVFRRYLCRSGG